MLYTLNTRLPGLYRQKLFGNEKTIYCTDRTERRESDGRMMVLNPDSSQLGSVVTSYAHAVFSAGPVLSLMRILYYIVHKPVHVELRAMN